MSGVDSFRRVTLLVALSIALVVSVLTAPGRAQTGPACVDAVPVDEITGGMTGHGLTVERGTTPSPFDAEVLGVLQDGIAPGVDLIIADLESPAIAETGVWAGMSGSPVYAEDGRLIGAVAYRLSLSASSIAGLTPAEKMLDLYAYPGATAGLVMADEVSLPAEMQQKVVAESDATLTQANEGFSQLDLPLAVSTLRPARFDKLMRRLGPDLNVMPVQANRAAQGAAPASDIVPGSNFVAALSYGDVTVAGVGTATDVCDGTALAFGHPMVFDGRTSLSAHTADVIHVQPDMLGGPYKLANIGGVVGTVDQDRLAGLRAPLGDGPEPTVVQSRIASTTLDRERAASTWVNRDKHVPDIAPFHTLANLDILLDKIGEGRVRLTWTAEGTRSNGSSWTITRSNRFADQFDVSFWSIIEMLDWLYVIHTNRFTEVEFDNISVTGSVSETFQRLRLGDVRVAVNGGSFRRIGAIDRLRVRPGDTIKVRAPLIKYREEVPFRTVNLQIVVPQSLAGRSVQLGVFGGETLFGEVDVFGGTSFDDILARMRRAESGNEVIARLQVSGDRGPRVFKKAEEALVNVVQGRRTLPVTVSG
jgi:hypothetical protein